MSYANESVHVYADEEIHIHSGLEPWCKTDHFKNLNIGFGFDEGWSHKKRCSV